MDWLWLTCGLICVWATLRVIGAERERRIAELRASLDLDAPPPEAAPAPVRSKAAR